MSDYWENITAIKNKQTEKGVKEYGQRLEDNEDLSIEDRIIMAEEEMIDALMYMEHLKKSLEIFTTTKLEYIREQMCDCYCKYPEKFNGTGLEGVVKLNEICSKCPLNNL